MLGASERCFQLLLCAVLLLPGLQGQLLLVGRAGVQEGCQQLMVSPKPEKEASSLMQAAELGFTRWN